MPFQWFKFLPAWVRARVEHRPQLLRAMSNAGWLSGDQVLRMCVGLLVSIWLARYLGPQEFGLFNYVVAFVALFGAVANLGLNGIVVRDLVNEPESASTTLGTAFLLQIISGIFILALAVTAIGTIRTDDQTARIMVAILSSAMVFRSTAVVKYWFEFRVESKYVVWVESGVFLFIAGVKVVLILLHAPLLAFAWAGLGEVMLAALGLLFVYTWRGGQLFEWRGRWCRAKSLLTDSWPLILSSMAVMIYMRIDQVMLGQMLGYEAVGIYSAAVRISEAWYFVPIAITASVFPAIIEARKQSKELYTQRLRRLYQLMIFLALIVAVPMSIMSDWVVQLLFGKTYQEAAPVLSISIWAGISVALSAVHAKWLLAEGMQKYGLLYAVTGAFINVVLNLQLIPRYGLQGAAWATLCAQTLPIFLQPFLPKARSNFKLMLYAFSTPFK